MTREQHQEIHQAVMVVSLDLLAGMVLPRGGTIVGVQLDPRRAGVMLMKVEHPDLPGAWPGDELPIIRPVYATDRISEDPNEVDQVTFLDWGIQECG